MGNSGILRKWVNGFQRAGTAINTQVIKRQLLRKQKKGRKSKGRERLSYLLPFFSFIFPRNSSSILTEKLLFPESDFMNW